MTTIYVLVALAACNDLVIHQMDVKTIVLNGEIDEIYMKQPDGFVARKQGNKVRRLRKSLYGLKLAPKQWHEKFDRFLTSTGFVVNEVDTFVSYRFGGGKKVVLCLYVDVILIFGTSIDVKSFFFQNFDMKDLREEDVMLNIKLIKDENEIILKQSHHVENILKCFGYSDSKVSPTPYDPNLKIHKNRGQGINQLLYSQNIGSLLYLVSATRPDISFAMNKLSRFTSNQGSDHYTGYTAVLEGYSDSNWISDADEIKPTSGCIHIYSLMVGLQFHGGLVDKLC
jgi:hypothetical protein